MPFYGWVLLGVFCFYSLAITAWALAPRVLGPAPRHGGYMELSSLASTGPSRATAPRRKTSMGCRRGGPQLAVGAGPEMLQRPSNFGARGSSTSVTALRRGAPTTDADGGEAA